MRILYLEGDPAGARYVSGTLTIMGVAHTLVRPGGDLPRDLSTYQAAVVSDFPAAQLHGLASLLGRAVRDGGLGLLMLGGRRSFGAGGYANSDLGELLPVSLEAVDDCASFPAGLVMEQACGTHPLLRGLPMHQPVSVVGCNRFAARPKTTTVFAGRPLQLTPSGVTLGSGKVPLLVVREAIGAGGRTAALATNLAPCWSGGLTEWGESTVRVSRLDEVGEGYATLVMNLVRWVAGEDTIRRPLPSWEQVLEIGVSFERLPSIRAADEDE